MTTRPKNRRSVPLIVFSSRTDNTRKVAEAMAKPLTAELAAIEQLKDHQLRGRPLIGLGSGVYWLRLDRRIIDLAARISSDCRVFIFSTSGWRGTILEGFFRSELERQLQQRRIEVVGRWHCPGQDKQALFKWLNISRGRPNAEDIRSAREFAASLKAIVNAP
jgi:flavodoxin